MFSTGCNNILQLYFQEEHTLAIFNNDYNDKRVLNEVNVEKALPLALNEFAEIKFKAVVFILDNHTLETQAFRLKCQKLCHNYGYFCYFASLFELSFNSIFSKYKVMVDQGQKVVYSVILHDRALFHILKRGENSYQFYKSRKCEDSLNNLKKIVDIIKSETKDGDVRKIVYFTHDTRVFENREDKENFAIMVNEALSSFNLDLIRFECVDTDQYFDGSYLKVMDAMNEKKNPYLVDTMLASDFSVTYSNDVLIQVKGRISLPYKNSMVFKVFSKDDFIELKMNGEKGIEKKSLAEFVNKKVRVTMEIDKNIIYTISIEPFEDEVREGKAKVVLTVKDYSILFSKNGKTETLKINGKEETPLYISFTDRKPIVGDAAKEILNQHPSFVVYDIVKLCSIRDPKDANPEWPFLVKFDENGKIIIEFETFEGKKKATPEFLLALIFRDCLSRLKKEIGQSVDELNIDIQGFGPGIHFLLTLKKSTALLKRDASLTFNKSSYICPFYSK